MSDIKFYRTNTVCGLTAWYEKNKAFLEITPSMEGAAKGQPKEGEKRYNYDNTVRISFQPIDMLIVSYKLLALSHGVETEYTKIGDMSKVANSPSNDKKFLTIKKGDKGGTFVSLTFGDKKAFFNMSVEETYAAAKWFEFQAHKLLTQEPVIHPKEQK